LDSIIVLEDKMREYFPNIDIEKYDWVRDPFHVPITDLSDLQLSEEEDLYSLKSDRSYS